MNNINKPLGREVQDTGGKREAAASKASQKASKNQESRHAVPQIIDSRVQKDQLSDFTVYHPPSDHLPLGFTPYSRTDDSAVIRSVALHPRGHVMAIGSNSRTLKLCAIPEEALAPVR